MKKVLNSLLAIGLISVGSMADAQTKVVETKDRGGLLGSGGFLGTGIGRHDKTIVIEKQCGPCDKAGHTEVKKEKKNGGLFGAHDETLIIQETECCENNRMLWE